MMKSLCQSSRQYAYTHTYFIERVDVNMKEEKSKLIEIEEKNLDQIATENNWQLTSLTSILKERRF